MSVSLVPDVIFDRYQEITPDYLTARGVTLLLSDLDFTLAAKSTRHPDEAVKAWIAGLRGAGITFMIVSNNRSGRRVTDFCAELGVNISDKALESHQAYVASWLKAIKEDHNALFSALKDADKIADYMMEQGRLELMKEEITKDAKLPGVLESGTAYEIWQLKDDPMNRSISFMPYNFASQFRITQGRYDKVYESSVSENDNSLDKIFVKYNIGRPSDFHGHSLSTSDIIVVYRPKHRILNAKFGTFWLHTLMPGFFRKCTAAQPSKAVSRWRSC